MKHTPERVREILVRSGRQVTLRQLTDWRQKHLLSELEREKGRGRAAKYVWIQPNIVKQAATIHDLLSCWSGRVEWLTLPRWLLDYDVPLEEVRRKFLVHLEHTLTKMTQGERDPEEVDEQLNDFASNLLYRWKYSAKPMPENFKEADPVVREAVMAFFLHLFADQDYQPDEELLTVVWRTLEAKRTTNVVPASEASGEITEIVRFVCEHLSLPRCRDAAAEATVEEWEQVHSDFRALLAALTTFYKLVKPLAAFPVFPFWMQIRLQYNLLVGFGLLLVPALLALRQDGYGHWIENGLAKVNEFLTDPEVREKMQVGLSEKQLQRATQR